MLRIDRRTPSRIRIKAHRTLQFESLESRALLAVVQLAPLQDATLYESATGDTANSVGAHLYVGTIAQNLVRRSLIEFNFNQIPAGSTINSVSLALNMSKTISGATTIGLQRSTKAWAEGPSNGLGFGSSEGAGGQSQTGDPTWIHSSFNTTLWSAPGGDFVATVSATQSVSGTGPYQWSGAGLAADVQQWIDNPTTNLGWFLKEQDEKTGTSAKQFDSRNNATAASRPKLTVDFTPPFSADPVINNFGGDVSYTENASPIAVAASTANVTDTDSTNFDQGRLTATLTVGGSASDRLSIRNTSRLTTNANAEVLFNSTVVGNFTGGVGTTPLVVTFDNDANPESAGAVLRNIVYRSLSERPIPQRTVSVELTDGDGGESPARSKKINAIAVNDAPRLNTTFNPVLASTAEDAPTPTSTLVKTLIGASITDPDAAALKGIAVTAATSTHGHWEFALVGTNWQSLDTTTDSPARLLRADATTRVRFVPAADFFGQVKLFYRAWDTTQGSAGGLLTTSGNTGGTKSLSTAYENAVLNVTPVNDAPKLTLGGTVGYVHNSSAITLAPSAGVSDIDSVDFFQGRLRVRITDGASASNQLAIGNGFSIDAANNVRFGTTIIGRRTSNGLGTNELIISFNTRNATPAMVQELVRSLTFKTVNGAAGLRKVVFTVSDGVGGVSPEVSKTVNVT